VTSPTAIYRPIQRDVLLTDGAASIVVTTPKAREIAQALANAHRRNIPRLLIERRDQRIAIVKADMLAVARDIDHALATPTIAAALLDEAR